MLVYFSHNFPYVYSLGSILQGQIASYQNAGKQVLLLSCNLKKAETQMITN
jgi:hypothetical protein